MSKAAGSSARAATSERVVPPGRADRATEAPVPYDNDGNEVPLSTADQRTKVASDPDVPGSGKAAKVANALAAGQPALDKKTELALWEYSKSGNRAMNAALRRPGGLKEMSGSVRREFALLNKAANASRFATNGVLWRGVNSKEGAALMGMKVGDIGNAKGLMSLSTHPTTALSHTRAGFDLGHDVIIRLSVKKGQRGLNVLGKRSNYPNEREFLLPHGSKVQKTGQHMEKVGLTKVLVIELNLVR